jgi:uncharacterized protein (DUF1499 family)
VTLAKAARATLAGVVALALVSLGAVTVGSAMGLFAGSRPATLGFSGGRFADGDWRPNWVSSTAAAADPGHRIAPIAIPGDPATAWADLQAAIAAMPRATVVTRSPGYLHVEFASRGLGFVDDAEFALDAPARVIHVKSAARLGVRDFSVNRDRVESIRAVLAQRGN